MPRDIPVGNGRLLVCFDRDYQIRDLYFPHVGQENHVEGNRFRMGIWIDGAFEWIGSPWVRELKYEEETLVTDISLYVESLGLLIKCKDTVDFHENVYIREIQIKNLREFEREVKIFFTQDFDISGSDVGDTAAFDPETGGIVHYKKARYFLVNLFRNGKPGVDLYEVSQKSGDSGGSFSDVVNGNVSGTPIAQGSVVSVVGTSLKLKGQSWDKLYYWIIASNIWSEVRRLNGLVGKISPQALIKRTRDYWKLWVRKESPQLDRLPEEVVELYKRSLLILRTQIDWKGGIVAANDSDIIHFNRDTYSYVWPRDGALVANSLDMAGYPVLARNFFEFAARAIEKEGYFLHKFNPDGTLASSWHPWYENGQPQLPIQEDETALVIWSLWNHFVLYRDIEFIKPLYRPLIKTAADFMCRYRDSDTGLPKESYDLWEERRGVPAFTVGAVFGGLTAASLFCKIFGEDELAEHYRKSAAEVRDAASSILWCEDKNRFCRMVKRDVAGKYVPDTTCDASLWGLFAFGMYSATDPRIRSTFDVLRDRLWIKTQVGGMARQENDYYHRVSEDVPGNPWFLCTLWYADYLAECAEGREKISQAIEILSWVAEHALPSGVLAEQLHPYTGEPLSVSPLTWSHAAFVGSVHRILRKLGKMDICPECGLPKIGREDDWITRLYDETCKSIYGDCKVK